MPIIISLINNKMKVAAFRTAILSLAIVAIFLLATIGVFFMTKSRSTTSCPAPPSCPVPRCPVMQLQQQPRATDRDRRVLTDPLYPPTDRTERQTRDITVTQIRQGNLYQNQDSTRDSFRLVGYLTNSEENLDAGRNNWKLFARMKDRHQGEYYIVPTNNTIDLKIPLTTETVVSERLRDVYTIPKEMRFNSPMLNRGAYTFTEIPKEDLSAPVL